MGRLFVYIDLLQIPSPHLQKPITTDNQDGPVTGSSEPDDGAWAVGGFRATSAKGEPSSLPLLSPFRHTHLVQRNGNDIERAAADGESLSSSRRSAEERGWT